MPSVDAEVEVLQQPDLPAAATVPVVAGERDEVEVVDDRRRPREVGEKNDGRLERADEDRLEPVVVAGDLGAELLDPGKDLLPGKVDLADCLRVG